MDPFSWRDAAIAMAAVPSSPSSSSMRHANLLCFPLSERGQLSWDGLTFGVASHLFLRKRGGVPRTKNRQPPSPKGLMRRQDVAEKETLTYGWRRRQQEASFSLLTLRRCSPPQELTSERRNPRHDGHLESPEVPPLATEA